MERQQVVSRYQWDLMLSKSGPDYAVLAMAVHSALQVFHPFTKTSSDGLYPYRLYVYTGALMVPSLMAGLAFVNSGTGYESLGAFCTLPIRPFWYRLALAWIPRYLVALFIIGLAVAIKTYVDSEFHSINEDIVASQTDRLPRLSPIGGSAEAAITTSNTMHQRTFEEGRGSVLLIISAQSALV